MIREIAKKYENVQKVSDMMRGPLIELEARDILYQGRREGRKETALRMLRDGKISFEKIAEYSGLSIEEVEQLADGMLSE